jgi:hypothetical protein
MKEGEEGRGSELPSLHRPPLSNSEPEILGFPRRREYGEAMQFCHTSKQLDLFKRANALLGRKRKKKVTWAAAHAPVMRPDPPTDPNERPPWE